LTLIRNLTSSPYDLAPGVILPANGEVDTDLPDWLVEALRAAPGVEIVEIVANDEIESWRKLYTDATGKKPDGRWSVARLMTEIERA